MVADPGRLQVGDHLQEPLGLGDRQARRRLVHDHEPALQRQRLGDLQQLPLRQRQLGDRRVRREVHPEPREDRPDLRRHPPPVEQPQRPAVRGSRPMKTLPAASRLSSRFSSWCTKAMPAPIAPATVIASRSAPSIRMRPRVGATTPPSTFISVDLPAPFSPTSPIDLAGLHGEAHVVERDDAGIELADPDQLEERLRHAAPRDAPPAGPADGARASLLALSSRWRSSPSGRPRRRRRSPCRSPWSAR